MAKNISVNLRLSPDEADKLDKLIEGTGLNRSAYIRMTILKDYADMFTVNPSEMSIIENLAPRLQEVIKSAILQERAKV